MSTLNPFELPNGLVIECTFSSVIASSVNRERFQTELGFPPPEMIFPKTMLKISSASHVLFSWNLFDVLKRLSVDPPKLVHYNQNIQLIPQWVPPSSIPCFPVKYDWTYSSSHTGIVDSANFLKFSILPPDDTFIFDKQMLNQNPNDPILFSHSLLLYEDEMGDHGKSIFTIRIRITSMYMFILTRAWLELPTQGIYRSIENRWMIKSSSTTFRHEYSIKEIINTSPISKVNTYDVFRDREASQLPIILEKVASVNL